VPPQTQRPYRGRAIFTIATPLFWALATWICYLFVFKFGDFGLGFFFLGFLIFVFPLLIYFGVAVTICGLIFAIQLMREGGSARKWGILGLGINIALLLGLAAGYAFMLHAPKTP